MLFDNKWIFIPLKSLMLLMLGGFISAHAAFLPTFTGTPAIDGTALVGNTLTIIDTGTLDGDGDTVTLSYQWLANDVPISGATADSYILTMNEAHANITAEVTADDDNDGPVTVTTAAITVINSAPTISGTPTTSVLEDSSYSFTPTAGDIDGDTLTFSITNQPAWTSFDTATGTLSGTPVNSHVGITTDIVITVSDSELITASLPSFNLQVINTNDPPTITNTEVTTATENVAYSYTLLANDVDLGDVLTLSAPVLPAWLVFNPTTGVLNGTPGNAEVGLHSVTLRVNDGTIDVDQSFTITVINANDAPTITSIAVTAATEDVAYSYTFAASDVDIGDLLTYSAPVLPTWLNFNASTGVLSGTPLNANVGSHPVTLRVNDGTIDVDQIFSITVTNVNDVPTISGIPTTSVDEDSSYSFTPTANDVDAGDTLTFSIANQPGWASFDSATGTLSGTPTNSDVGITNGILITVIDSSLASSSLPSFNLEVINTNDAPIITSTALALATEDIAYTYTLSATDIDIGDVLTYSAPVLPSWLSFNTTTGELSGTPSNADTGSHPVTLRVNDGTVDVDQSFSITVTNVNNAPTISGTPITSVAEDSSYSFTPIANDVDAGDILSFSITNQPAWASFDTTTGTLSGTPANSAVGITNGIIITVTDASLASASLPAFNLQVTNTNDAPTISSTAITDATEDENYSYTFIATDVDIGDTLTYSAVTVLPAWLDFNTTTGVLSGTPGNADVSSYPITLRVSDGTVNTDQNFTITVANANDAPTITSTAVTTATEDIAYSYTFVASDIDVGDLLTYSAPVLPTWLSFNTTTGVLSGTPINAEVGSHSVTLRVSDDSVNVDQSFTIIVGNANDAPVITGMPVTRVVEGQLYNFLPSAVDADTEDTLTFVITNMPAWSAFDTVSGALSGMPMAANVGTTSGIIIGVSDGTVTVNLPAFSITVVGDLDGDTIGDDVDSDIDGDGMPNTFETDNGLDPRNAADAVLDMDGDGVSNLDEFRRGTNPGFDEVPPLVIAPADITINATGLYTRVDTGQATAVDALDGVLPVVQNLGNHLPAGTHVLTWSATDTAGNTGTAIQTIHIIPLVSFSIDQLVAEGNTATINIKLNGPAVNYPVIVPYTVSGSATAGSDHNLINGSITLNSGTEAQLSFNILDDGPGDAGENIVIMMGTPTNAIMGARHVHTIKIAEGNIAPHATLSADQGQGTTRIISQANGIVTITANISDPNITDIHSFDWSGSDNALVDLDATSNTFSFDPTTVTPGIYTLHLTVSDGMENDVAELAIHVVNSMPALTTDDTDGDGIDDITEGYADSDNDGVPNYLDAITVQNVLQGQSASSRQHLMETETGLGFALGLIAFQANPGQAIITASDIVNYSNSPEDELPNVGGLFDYVITGLPEAGQSARLVLPLLAPIPIDASFRKLMPTGWQDFVEDSKNSIYSAPGEQAYCPPPGDVAYTPGLTTGHWCVQLLIEDGGPNDADLRANKRIADPGGLVQLRNITVNVKSSGGAIYISLLLLLLWRLWFIFREKKS